VATDTTEGLLHLGDEPAKTALRRRRLGYGLTTFLLCAIVGAAVLDAATPLGIYGVQTRTTSATSPDGLQLEVRYGSVSRPALATPFDIRITSPGGFDGPVTVAVRSEYLALWDENGLDPSPSEETADGETTLWTFDPPDGDVLGISFDARIEPAAQNGESGRVAVVDDDGVPLVFVDFTTRVLP
jgi:hypothetical protein